jgi:2-iminobutanoate/2-iminopropanoate deaminase
VNADLHFIAVPDRPTPRGHYSPGVACGGFLFVSGQLPVDEADAPQLGSVEDQALLCLNNLDKVLRAAGTRRDRVVKCTVFVADVAHWAEVNRAYAEFFGGHRPARSVVPCGALHFGAAVEIEAIAALGG